MISEWGRSVSEMERAMGFLSCRGAPDTLQGASGCVPVGSNRFVLIFSKSSPAVATFGAGAFSVARPGPTGEDTAPAASLNRALNFRRASWSVQGGKSNTRPNY
jgi:hypothetical protein